MSNTFNFTFPTFNQPQEFNEIILDISKTTVSKVDSIEDAENANLQNNSIDEISESIVAQMMVDVNQDISRLSTKA